jgi:hypothetical protein
MQIALIAAVPMLAALFVRWNNKSVVSYSIYLTAAWCSVLGAAILLRQSRFGFVEPYCGYGWIGVVAAIGLLAVLVAHCVQLIEAKGARMEVAIFIAINAFVAAWFTAAVMISFMCMAVP